MRTLRLSCSAFWVEVRVTRLNGRWLASADTRDGPSIGLGRAPLEAIVFALRPFDGMVDELLETLPEELFGR